MAVTAKPKPKPEPKPDLMDGLLDLVEVPRAWIERNGPPSSYLDLKALAGAETEGFKQLRARRGDIVVKSYTNCDVAYYREGSEDQAFLYAQCWRKGA